MRIISSYNLFTYKEINIVPFFSLLLIYNKDINISKGSYKVDLHHLIKAAGFVLATLLLYFQK